MSIPITCPHCQRQLVAPPAAAGKRVKCPSCQNVLAVPDVPTVTAPAMMATTERWYVLAHDGNQYGPLTRAELDAWYLQGRLAPHSQLLREGDAAWQWATVLYPALVQPQVSAPVRSVAITTQRPPRSRPTETVSLVALLNYVISGLLFLAGVTLIVAGMRIGAQTDEALVRRGGDVRGLSATAAGGLSGVCFASLPMAIALAYGAAGYGVMDRRQWGRIMTFVMAGISIVPALVALCVFGFTGIVALLGGAEAESQLLMTLGISFVFTVLFTGYTIYCFNILVRQKYAAEFR